MIRPRTATAALVVFLLAISLPPRLRARDPGDLRVQYSHDVWDVNRGLTAFSINAITQTPDGYLWLGTDEGVVRFDGVRFTHFSTANTPGLGHNNISSLAVLDDSSLWVGTTGGALTGYRRGAFTSYGAASGLPGNILSLASGPGRELWIGTASTGIFRMADGRFERRFRDSVRGDWLVYALHADSAGTVSVGFGSRLAVRAPHGDSLRSIGKASGVILSMCRLRDGHLAIGTRDRILLFDGSALRPFPVAAIAGIPSARAILEDQDGNLWIGTEGSGLYRYSHGTLTHLGAADGVQSDRILSIHEDAERNVWIGTRGGGLLRFRRSTIVMLSPEPPLPSGQISTVFGRHGDELWIGTRDAGLSEIRGGRLVRTYTTRQGLAGNFVRGIFGDDAGNLWIGTQEGLQVLRPNGGAYDVQQLRAGELPILSVRTCIQDKHGDIWIGSSADGVYVVRRGSMRVSAVPRSLPGEYIPVRILLEDSRGRIWVGTRGGLGVIENDTLKAFTSPNGVAIREIFAFHEDHQGALWIGTYGEGLFRLKNGASFQCTKLDGLFDDVIYSILDDGLGSYWMSCNKGLFRVSERELNDLADGKVRSVNSTSFGTADGMKSVECNGGSQPSGWVTEDGRLLFPTMNGVALVRPGPKRETSRDPVPVIEEIVAGDRVFRSAAAVILEPDMRKFEALYTGLSFVLSERIEFRYLLAGFDERWIEAGTSRKISYTNIPPGEYVLEVAARHPGADWNVRTASIAITVLPHVWERAWFRVAAAGAVLLGMFLLVRRLATRGLRQRLRELEAQQSLDRERARISRDMHDEVGASLTQISILSELLQRNIGQKDVAEGYLRKISATAHDVVESLDEIVWFINPKHDTLESLLFFIREHLTDFCESAEIECRFDVPEAVPALPLSADVRRDIFMAVKEAATNVVKHSGATEVLVRARVEGRVVEIRIEDNGRGVPEEQRSVFSDGLDNMTRRMKNLGGTCEIRSTAGGGTSVILRAEAGGRHEGRAVQD